MPTPPGHALVVGGTGMLAGLTRALVARGRAVTSLARRPAGLGVDDAAALTPVAVDYRDSDGLAAALAHATAERGPIELGVCWIHTDAPDAPAIVARALAPGARLVQVFGTTHWPLTEVPAGIVYRQVLLGAVGDRWLTHAEISAGVLAAIEADQPLHVVGARA